jgi:hypothetical protein
MGLFVPFGSGMGKCPGDHLDEPALVNADGLAAGTKNLIAGALHYVYLFHAGFMAAEQFALADLVVFPQFGFAGGAFNGQHIFLFIKITQIYQLLIFRLLGNDFWPG